MRNGPPSRKFAEPHHRITTDERRRGRSVVNNRSAQLCIGTIARSSTHEFEGALRLTDSYEQTIRAQQQYQFEHVRETLPDSYEGPSRP
jgi:hypothetical protein